MAHPDQFVPGFKARKAAKLAAEAAASKPKPKPRRKALVDRLKAKKPKA